MVSEYKRVIYRNIKTSSRKNKQKNMAIFFKKALKTTTNIYVKYFKYMYADVCMYVDVCIDV